MSKQELVDKLARELKAVKAERISAKTDPSLLAARTAVKQFQSERLEASHAALLAAPDTRGAAEFFLEELYGAHDLSQRDTDLERIIPTLQRVLPYEPLHAITEAIVLDALSEKLDSAMARALGEQFTPAQYAEAYRSATSRAERERQLDLVEQLGQSLCDLVRIPMLSVTLSIMRVPASLAGLEDLHAFLETGFTTFKRMRKPADFVASVVGRERAVMAALYACADNPFDA